MKKAVFGVVAFIFSLIFSLNLAALDLEKDQQILDILTSNEFINVVIDYEFEETNYPIRIIHNPTKEVLWGKRLTEPTTASLIMIANTSIALERYLEDLVLELRGTYDDSKLILRNGYPLSSKFGWNTTKPIHLATSLDDTLNEAILANIFFSSEFQNKVIYYQLNGEFFQVRLLHNPEGKTFTETRRYNLNNYGVTDLQLEWKNKYAILIDKNAPKALTNHLSKALQHLSYWDWFFNYTFSNATKVQFRWSNYTWDLDTWFDLTENFHE